MSIPAPLPPVEERRLSALYEYELLDTPPEELFDAFTDLVAQLCDVPIALITLIDRPVASRTTVCLPECPASLWSYSNSSPPRPRLSTPA